MELYSYVPPLGMNISIFVQPFLVDDSVPTEDEIEWAVTRLCNHRSRGPSGMRSEHLKRWLATAQKVEEAENKATTKTDRAVMTENGGSSEAQAQSET